MAKQLLDSREEERVRAMSGKLSVAYESDNEHDSWVCVSQRGYAKGSLGDSREGRDRFIGLKPHKFTV